MINRLFRVILFWGSLWGLTGATPGYEIHRAALPACAVLALLMAAGVPRLV